MKKNIRKDFGEEQSAHIDFLSAEDIENIIRDFAEQGEKMPRSLESELQPNYIIRNKDIAKQ